MADNVHISVLSRNYNSVSFNIYTQDSAYWTFKDCRIRANRGSTTGTWQYFTPEYENTWSRGPCYVTGLSPYTSYSFEVQVKWTDTGNWSASYYQTQRTLGNATIISSPAVQPDMSPFQLTIRCTTYASGLYYKVQIFTDHLDIYSNSLQINATGTADRTFQFSSSARSSAINYFGSAMTKTKVWVRLYTYSNSACTNAVDSVSYLTNITIQLSEQYSRPTFSDFTFQDIESGVTAVTGSNQIMLQTFSNLKVVAGNASANNGAELAKYEVIVGRVTKAETVSRTSLSSKTINFGKIDTYGEATAIIVRVTDSRGFKTSVTKYAKVIRYERPKLSRYIVNREDEVEETIQVNLAGSISSIVPSSSEVNSLQMATFSYKRASDDTWTDLPILSRLTINGMNFSYTVNELLDDLSQAIRFDENSSYDFRITLQDSLGTMTETVLDLLITAATGAVTILGRTTQYPFPRVGINQAKPTEALEVVGNIKLSGVIKTPTGQVMSYVQEIADGQSFASFKGTGIYFYPYEAGVCVATSAPTTAPGFLEVYATSSGYALQRFTTVGGNSTTYERTYYNSSWSSWITL